MAEGILENTDVLVLDGKILRFDLRTGIIEHGKDVNIVVSEGDILDMHTSKVRYAFIQGKLLNPNGKQQALNERYKEKYGQQKIPLT